MKVIDFHTHIYPDKIAAKAVDATRDFYHIPIQCSGTVSELLEHTHRINRFVVFSAAAIPAQVKTINDFIASVCSEHLACSEHSEFTGFGTLHHDMENPQDEIERLIKLGLCGVKFHPDMQRFNIDDNKMMDVYAALEGRLPVIFHTGDYRYSFSHPSRLAHVLDNFPGLCVIAAHFGGWSLFDIASDHLYSRRCYFDVSSSLPFLGLRRAAELINHYGAERFLFGSDYPMWNPSACLDEFLRLDLTAGQKEMILWKNAEIILKR